MFRDASDLLSFSADLERIQFTFNTTIYLTEQIQQHFKKSSFDDESEYNIIEKLVLFACV